MVSEFGLTKDVEPAFQLWRQDGTRIDENDEKKLINQPHPKQVSIVRDTIIFNTPAQPKINAIYDKEFTIKLVPRRKNYEVESEPFYSITCRMMPYLSLVIPAFRSSASSRRC